MDKVETLFWQELEAVTVDTWSDDEIAECPEFAEIIADVKARRMTAAVLHEAGDCLTRDWCKGKIATAFLTILARNGELERYNPDKIWSYRPRTKVIEGVKYVV